MLDGKRRRAGWLISVPFVLGTAVLVSSCSEPLTGLPPGASLVNREVVILDTTVYATGGSSFRQHVPMDSRSFPLSRNLLGRFGGYTAYMALQFNPNFIPHRDTVQVISAKITVRGISWFGDSTGNFGFTVHKILEGWNQSTLSWDSLQARPGFYELTPRGSYSGFIEGDTATFSFDIDTALARQWLLTRTVASYGILLVPTPSTGVVRGIHAFDFDSSKFYPSLEIIASNLAGTIRDTSTYLFGFDTFLGNIDNLNTNPQLLYVQAGVAYRSRINFDVSFIKRGAIINSATVLLEMDPATSRFSKFTTDSVLASHLLRDGSDSTRFESLRSEGRRVGGTPGTFSFEARRAVQFWLAATNNGLLIRQTDATEYSTFDLFTFHNHLAANPNLRPRLRVIYTLEKN